MLLGPAPQQVLGPGQRPLAFRLALPDLRHGRQVWKRQ